MLENAQGSSKLTHNKCFNIINQEKFSIGFNFHQQIKARLYQNGLNKEMLSFTFSVKQEEMLACSKLSKILMMNKP